MDVLVHLLTNEEAAALPATGSHAPASLARQGFIHLCHPQQVDAVRARFFPDVTVVALLIDAARVRADVVEEDSYGHGAFPHLYAPLPLDAVTRRVVLSPSDRFDAARI